MTSQGNGTLHGKRALITGADSGIGQATAELFARQGADVAITYNTDADGARETARRVEAAGRRCLVIQNDVGDPASVEATFAQVAQELGVLDILVNNAGQAMSGMPVAEMDDGKLEQILRVNLMAPVFCARAFIKVRRAQGGRGKIVIVSSVAQHLPTPESAPYGMSKAGVGSLCRSLARELAEDRINVNNVAPGLIETPMTADRFENPDKLAQSLERIPWHRAG
jgi:glucose 1-dehydrogenase